MRNLKNSRKKILILILVFIIILCVLFKMLQSKNLNFQEDLIFFKLFGIGNIQESSEEEIKNNNENENFKNNVYEIGVKKRQNSYKKIDLLQSIDLKTLVNEKIAPGTKGSFDVYLISNEDINYEIEIVDKNKSPKNFKFEISEKIGKIKKDEMKKVQVNWEWPYEINEKENKQDTKDGENIEKYDFEICTIGR